MAKIKLTEKTSWHVIVLNPVNTEELFETSALKLTSREKIELEVVHISLKGEVSLQLKAQ